MSNGQIQEREFLNLFVGSSLLGFLIIAIFIKVPDMPVDVIGDCQDDGSDDNPIKRPDDVTDFLPVLPDKIAGISQCYGPDEGTGK